MGNAPIWFSFLLRLQHYSRQHQGRCLFTRLISSRPHLGTLSLTHSHRHTHSVTHLAGTLAGTLELAHTLSEEANNLRFWPVHIITTNVAGEAQAAGNRQQATGDRTTRNRWRRRRKRRDRTRQLSQHVQPLPLSLSP